MNVLQDIKALWQMSRFKEFNLDSASTTITSILRHSWYLDPAVVVFALADEEYPNRGEMAKKLFSLPRPKEFPLDRQVVNKEVLLSLNYSGKEPPSLAPLITEQSWMIFDMLKHNRAEIQWMKLPPEFWNTNDFYCEFTAFIKNIAVVNDASERAIKLVQELIDTARSEEKRQDNFLFSNVYKRNRKGQKKTDYKAAALKGISEDAIE